VVTAVALILEQFLGVGSDAIKILDFGLAKRIDTGGAAGEAISKPGRFAGGTLPYASPEQLRGEADWRSDLYALGVMLYEMLTGRRPFEGNARVLWMKTLGEAPPPFEEVAPEVSVPAAVEAAVLACLEKDPEKRPQSARALLDAFSASVASAGEEGGRGPSRRALWRGAGRPAPRQAGRVIAAKVLVILLALALGATAAVRLLTPRSAHAVPALRVDVLPPDPSSPGTKTLALSQHEGVVPLELVELPRTATAIGTRYNVRIPRDQRAMEVKPFAISRTEVTCGQYEMIMGRPVQVGRGREDSRLPRRATWDEAEEFCHRLKAALGDGVEEVRLPWEIEWEYAATCGGERSARDVNEEGASEAGGKSTWYSVELERRNPWGICGLVSNGREWLQDSEIEDTKKRSFAARDGQVDGDRARCVVGVRIGEHHGAERTGADQAVGFRIVVRWKSDPAVAGRKAS
jgi:formylglycine-generating enzyme required for sulfatase activity